MNARTSTLDNASGGAKRGERARGAKRGGSARGAKGAEDKRGGSDRKSRSSEDGRAGGKKGTVAVRAAVDTDSSTRSGAARRAYERRQQRAALHRGDTAAIAVLPKRSSQFAARIPYVATVIGLLACGLVCTLLLTTRSAEDSYELSAARVHNQQLSQQLASLQRDVETADSAPDLAAKARELGMIPAKDPARLVVAPDGGVAVVGTPTPAQGPPVPLLNGQSRDNTVLGTARSAAGSRATAQIPTRQTGAGDTPQRTGVNAQPQGEQLVPMAIPGQASSGQPR
jgi:hypothetical protein